MINQTNKSYRLTKVGTIEVQKTQKKSDCRVPGKLLAFATLLASLVAAQAQTLNFSTTPPILTPSLYVGGGAFSGSYTNLQLRAAISPALDPANPVTFVTAGAPAGVTISFSGTGTTNTVTNILTVAVNNVTPGIYPITISALTNGVPFGTASTNFTLVVGNLWTNQSKTTVDWGTGANWSTGVPGLNDNVMFQDAGENTNFVNTSTTIGSLTYVRNLGSSNIFTTIANGATLAIAGPRGFYLNEDTQSPLINKGMTVRFAGFNGAALVVTNETANYSVNGASTGAIGANSGTTLNMTNLDQQFVRVERIGFGDATLADRGSVGAQQILFEMAKTNIFIATYPGSFEGPTFTNAIQFAHQADISNSGYSHGNALRVDMGITNAFLADSIRIGGNAAQGNLNTIRFAPVFTNNAANPPVAYFRNTNGGRMNFVGIAVGSGLHTGNRFTRAQLFAERGILDMAVDTMWLGVNRINDSSTGGGNPQTGTLIFGGTTNPSRPSIVDVNTLVVGNQLYTNNAYGVGRITVQTNAILIVNNVMELGHTTGDTNSGTTVVQGNGQVTINGGLARINQVTLGTHSTNNQIIIGTGGHLIVSNTIASPDQALTVLNLNGARLTFHVTAGETNAYVTNLVTGAAVSTINIASLTGFSPSVPATNVLIKYQDSAASHNIAIGSIPAGFNNISLVDNLADKTIELRIQTNAPATLRWRGGENSNWDHTSLNWQNTTTLATTRFFDGDNVIFDNSAAVPTTIFVTESINPGQVGTGILVSNTTTDFVLANGGGSIGNCQLVKTGGNALQLDVPTTASVQVDQGTLTGAGTVGGTIVSAGAALDFGGSINGALQVSGNAALTGGTVNNTLAILSGGTFTNSGSIQGGSLTINSGALLHNTASGSLANIGAADAMNVSSDALLINEGNIGAPGQANTLRIQGTFKDNGLGTIYLTTLSLDGGSTFLPGGDGIGTTSILSPGAGSNPGLIRMLAGSTTIIKVDFAHSQTNTIVMAQRHAFGPNSSVKNFNGCTILVTNINTGAGLFAAGQSFRMFQNSDPGIGSGNIGDAGLNTTNTYPIITPVIPAANTKWDLASLRETDPNGFVNIISFPTTGTNLAYATFVADGTNQVSHLQWPSTYIGWSLQQQTNSLNIGLSTNWTTVAGSSATNEIYITNSVNVPASFFRMVYP